MEVLLGLMNLQHRGQDGAGVLGVDREGFHLVKEAGLIHGTSLEGNLGDCQQSHAIGHTRYATVGGGNTDLLQPFLDREMGLSIAHNGNIVNYLSLKEELATKGLIDEKHFVESDSFVLLLLLKQALKNQTASNNQEFFAPLKLEENQSEIKWRFQYKSAIFNAIKEVMQQAVGSYAITGLLQDGTIFGFRDPHGIRPLLIGSKIKSNGQIERALASESVALVYLGFSEIEEILPGQAVLISPEGEVVRQVLNQKTERPCMFEWVYFSRVESTMNPISVYQARFNLGVELGKRAQSLGVTADVVVPVPETSRVSAIALAEYLQLPFRELLVKNRYVNRTFILDNQESREEALRRKLFPIEHEFAGKRCLVVDDSIVRGNTAKLLVKLIRKAGAKEVTLLSCCPPIANPCYYGIDFPNVKELLAANRTQEQMAEELGADRVIFQSLEGLKAALGRDNLCTGCLNQDYPTDISSFKRFAQQRLNDRETITLG
jgi:amidophosphoribosyltransferase